MKGIFGFGVILVSEHERKFPRLLAEIDISSLKPFERILQVLFLDLADPECGILDEARVVTEFGVGGAKSGKWRVLGSEHMGHGSLICRDVKPFANLGQQRNRSLEEQLSLEKHVMSRSDALTELDEFKMPVEPELFQHAAIHRLALLMRLEAGPAS